MQQLVNQVKSKRIAFGGGSKVSAGQTTQTSEVFESLGEGFRMTLGMGAIVDGGVQSVKIQQGNLADGSDMADLADSKIDILDSSDNKIVQSDIYRPTDKYSRVVVSRATQNSEIDFCLIDFYALRLLPPTLDTTVQTVETLASPLEGTA